MPACSGPAADASLQHANGVLPHKQMHSPVRSEHAEGAVSASMFRRTAGDGPWDRVKKVVMAFIAQKV